VGEAAPGEGSSESRDAFERREVAGLGAEEEEWDGFHGRWLVPDACRAPRRNRGLGRSRFHAPAHHQAFRKDRASRRGAGRGVGAGPGYQRLDRLGGRSAPGGAPIGLTEGPRLGHAATSSGSSRSGPGPGTGSGSSHGTATALGTGGGTAFSVIGGRGGPGALGIGGGPHDGDPARFGLVGSSRPVHVRSACRLDVPPTGVSDGGCGWRCRTNGRTGRSRAGRRAGRSHKPRCAGCSRTGH
jgi:hypothetical protein